MITYICDGCQKPCEPNERGIVKKKQYCDSCVVQVDQFIQMKDELHTEISDRWKVGLEKLTDDFKKTFLGTLPDD